MKYHGNCHCGQIAFDVEGEIPDVMKRLPASSA